MAANAKKDAVSSDEQQAPAKARDGQIGPDGSATSIATRFIQEFREAELERGFGHPDPQTLLKRIQTLEEVLGRAPRAIEELKKHLEMFLRDPVVQSYLSGRAFPDSLTGDNLYSFSFLNERQRIELEPIKYFRSDIRNGIFLKLFRTPQEQVDDLVALIVNRFLKKIRSNKDVIEDDGMSVGGSSLLKKPFRRARDQNRPRWADENRPTVRFPMRMSAQLIAEIDDAASQAKQNRNAWVCSALQQFVQADPELIPEDSPEYKASKTVTFRLPPRLNDSVAELAKRSGLNKTEWARRIIRHQLAKGTPALSPSSE